MVQSFGSYAGMYPQYMYISAIDFYFYRYVCINKKESIYHIVFWVGIAWTIIKFELHPEFNMSFYFKKNLKFFRMYYFYTICVLILTLVQGFVCFGLFFDNRFGYSTNFLSLELVASGSTFFVYLCEYLLR